MEVREVGKLVGVKTWEGFVIEESFSNWGKVVIAERMGEVGGGIGENINRNFKIERFKVMLV